MPPGPQYPGGQMLTPEEQQRVGMTPPGPLGLLGPGASPPRSALEREMPPGLSFLQRLRAYGPGLLGSLVALGGRGPLTRTVGGALAAGGTSKLLGGDFGPEAGKFAATQGLFEAGAGAGRTGISQARTGRLVRETEAKFAQAQKDHTLAVEKQKVAFQNSLKEHQERVARLKDDYLDLESQRTETIKKNQQVYEQAHREFAQRGAAGIADAYKSEVPSWKDFSSDERGLAEMVYGKGQERLSTMYDKALKEVVESGRGIKVPMRIEDLDALKLKSGEFLDSGMKGHPPTHALIDAGELAQALPGTWKKNRGAYRRGFETLDQQNLGNEAARDEYRKGQSLIDFTDKSKMLAGGQFDPESARKALYSLKTVDTLRKRGEGDVFRGPIADAAQAAPPTAPVELPETPKPILPPRPLRPSPLTPPEKPQTGITKHEAPVLAIPGLMAGALAGHATGIPHLTWAGAIAGEEAGRRLGPRIPIYTGGPQTVGPTPSVLPTALAELLRLYLTRPGATSSQ